MSVTDRIKVVVFLVAALCWLGERSRHTVRGEIAGFRAGHVREAVRRLQRPLDELEDTELGPRAPWVGVLRDEVPRDGIVGLSVEGEAADLAQTLLALRLLTYPRRIEPSYTLTKWIQEDWSRLDERVFGLAIGDGPPPPYEDHWREVASGPGFVLRRWARTPR
ncbi:MAG: hypothetical protein KDB53_00285 [Planctomycetes bacterium]|nr:hypothetical protein [Planctomycetota bacterium]